MLSRNSVPPTPMIVREPSRATTGARMRLTRNPINPSVTRRPDVRTRLKTWIFVMVAGTIVVQLLGAAVTEELTSSDITRALSIARGSEKSRTMFHAPYVVPVSDASIERLEVITEFRRFVLASEEQSALGNWMVARGGYDAKGRTLKDMLQRWRGTVAIKTRIRFHPHHRYSAVPTIDILLDDPTLLSLDTTRVPLGASPASPDLPIIMTGVVVETAFNAPSVGNRVLPVRVLFGGKELVRVMVDFSALD